MRAEGKATDRMPLIQRSGSGGLLTMAFPSALRNTSPMTGEGHGRSVLVRSR